MTDFGVPTLLHELTDEEAKIISLLARRQAYADGETIHEQGDPAGGLSIVIAGQVKLVKRQPDGSLVLLATVNPGQNYGEVFGFPFTGRTHTAIAVGETVLDTIGPDDFQALLEHAGILRHLYDIAIYRLSRAVELLDDMRTLPVEGRLAKLLLGMVGKADRSSRIQCLQEDLANTLGVSGMTLAKALAALRKRGLVTTGYRWIEVPDIARMRQWAAEL